MTIDLERLDGLMARMRALGVAELSYENGDTRIALRAEKAADAGPSGDAAGTRRPMHAGPLPATSPAATATPGPTETMRAPMHGVFYASPAPDAPRFVQVGDRVEAGAPLAILEVMKTLSRLEAEFPCIIRAVLCDNGTMVAPGASLFAVERIDG